MKSTYNERFVFANPLQSSSRATRYRAKKRQQQRLPTSSGDVRAMVTADYVYCVDGRDMRDCDSTMMDTSDHEYEPDLPDDDIEQPNPLSLEAEVTMGAESCTIPLYIYICILVLHIIISYHSVPLQLAF